MALELTLVPITPKRAIIDTVGFVDALDRELATNFAGAVIRDMTNYPPVKPWARGFPKKGLRRGGRRTGRYGRNWRLSAHRRGTFVRVSNRTAYAVHVGGSLRGTRVELRGPSVGPETDYIYQAEFMGFRGWISISTSIARHWPRVEGRIVAIIRSSGQSRRPFPS